MSRRSVSWVVNVEAESERRHQPCLQPEELWCSLQGWDGTNFQSSGVLPPSVSSSHFPQKKGGGETKKSEVVKKEEVGRVGRKGRKESQTHGRVWSGEEQREARHCFFFYARASLCLLHQDSYFASFTSQFVESLTDCPVFPPKICLTCGCMVCLCDITKGTDISRHPTNLLAPPTGT